MSAAGGLDISIHAHTALLTVSEARGCLQQVFALDATERTV